MWTEATYGRISGDWTPFNKAWTIAEKYIIPPKADQPTNSGYKADDPATYAPESDNQRGLPGDARRRGRRRQGPDRGRAPVRVRHV